ncbi:MAG: acylaldehyde oxidase, partial [Acidobacteria bacterium]|nr:acylaldehyde oxidase [Acidobacteriota bacterium]
MIGKPHDRVDGRQKVTGTARYAAENNLPNLVHAVVVAATIPTGTIAAIDSSAALKAPGVIAVISHLNAPKLAYLSNAGGGQNETGGKPPSPSGGGPTQGGLTGGNFPEPRAVPFTDDQVRYVGQQVAVVVADTLEHATHGAELVNVRYAASSGGRTDMNRLRGDAKDKPPGPQSAPFVKGDPLAAFAAAPVTIDHTYRTPYEHHNPLEAHSIVADWDGDHLTLHDSSQNIFATRSTLAKAFGIPKENIRVLSPFVGGAFGSKGSMWPHVLIGVIAARKVKRPVKLWLTRKQLFFTNGHRPETEQRVALGATADGKLVSVIHEGISQSNAFCDYNERFSRPTRVMYATPNMRAANPVVELDLASPTYMRAPGENPGMFALESALDELAYALKLDPVQLRLINHAEADPSDGKPWSSKSLKECYA